MLDDNDCEVKQGEIGELLVRTATMMKGYWCQAELTKKSLYKMEKIPTCKEVFYRTGDLTMKNDKGDLLFMGRKDRQIKLRGYRIELDEIESVLLANANINEAAVYTFKNGIEELFIATTIVLKDELEFTENDLHEEIKRYLPRHIKLHKISVSKQLPRTSAGKVDHKMLEEKATETI